MIIEEKTVEIKNLQQKIGMNKEETDIFKEILDVKPKFIDLEQSFSEKFEFLVNFVVDLSQKYLFSQRIITKIIRFMQDKDAEIIILRNKILMDHFTMNFYIPVKTDNIDLAMGEFINSRPSYPEVPFIRIDQGVYLFGSKVVKVKLQNNKIIVCLGGGFMSLEKFIEKYSVSEQEKFHERNQYDKTAGIKNAINESKAFLSIEDPISPIFPLTRNKTKRHETSFNTNFLDHSGSLSSSLISNKIQRSLTRKTSTLAKYS